MEDLGDWSLVRPIAVFVVIVRESKTCPHDLYIESLFHQNIGKCIG